MVKSRNFKRLFSIIIAILMIMGISITAFASDYTSSGSFKVSMTSSDRYFDGNTIAIDANSSSTNTSYTVTNYKVTLQRKHWYGYEDVGSSTLPKEGRGVVIFSNVGSGTYRLYYSRANDGGTQHINSARIYSY